MTRIVALIGAGSIGRATAHRVAANGRYQFHRG